MSTEPPRQEKRLVDPFTGRDVGREPGRGPSDPKRRRYEEARAEILRLAREEEARSGSPAEARARALERLRAAQEDLAASDKLPWRHHEAEFLEDAARFAAELAREVAPPCSRCVSPGLYRCVKCEVWFCDAHAARMSVVQAPAPPLEAVCPTCSYLLKRGG